MWRTTLLFSFLPVFIITLFYFACLIIAEFQLYATDFDAYLSIILLLLIYEWWRSLVYLRNIRGEFALFFDIHQIYWNQQRWYIIEKALLFRYLVILRLRSRRDGYHQTLFIMSCQVSANDWRSLHFYLNMLNHCWSDNFK